MASTRFDVALSFSSTDSKYVSRVVAELEKELGDKLFYSKKQKAKLARSDLDTFLEDIYLNQSKLCVAFISAGYEKSYWCSREWRCMRQIQMNKETDKLMYLKFDDTKLPGLLGIDGYVDLRNISESETADLILERYNEINKTKPKEDIDRACAILLKDNNPFNAVYREAIEQRFPKIKFLDPEGSDVLKGDMKSIYQELVLQFLEDKQLKYLITICYPDQKDFYNGLVSNLLNREQNSDKKKIIFIDSGFEVAGSWVNKDSSSEGENPYFVLHAEYELGAERIIKKLSDQIDWRGKQGLRKLAVVFIYPDTGSAKPRSIVFQSFLAEIIRQTPVKPLQLNISPGDLKENISSFGNSINEINLIQLPMDRGWGKDDAINLVKNNMGLIKDFIQDKDVLLICGNDEIAFSIFSLISEKTKDDSEIKNILIVGFDGLLNENQTAKMKNNGSYFVTASIDKNVLYDEIKLIFKGDAKKNITACFTSADDK